ncbi:MAG: glycosyltransferase family 39 protein [Candidatus Omnitrophica bacterium]|nr:glycosyltransferase family 39 protein [Candidatus Omnitrophota bacterium]
MKLNRYGLLLLIILLIGLSLRLYKLTSESIWLDEGIAIKLALANPFLVIIERAFNNHPPLFFVLLHYWCEIFDYSIYFVRLFAVMFGILTIYMIYKVGRLIFNETTALLSALLVSVSLFHIYYSQEARMYTMIAFLTLLSMYFFIRLFEQKKRLVSIGYTVSSLCLLYTHYSSWYVVLIQNLHYLTIFPLYKYFYKEKCQLDFKRWFEFQGVLVISYLPWLKVALSRLSRIQGARDWIPIPTPFSVTASFTEFSGTLTLLVIFLILIFFLAFPIKRSSFNLRLPAARNNYLLWLWLLIPIFVPYLTSQFSASLYVTKYAISASLAFYLLIALGIDKIKDKYVKFVTIGLILILSMPLIKKYYVETNKLPWEEIARYVEKNAKRGDLIIFNDRVCSGEAFGYYFTRLDVKEKVLMTKESGAHLTDINKGENVEALWSAVQGYDRVWIMLIHNLDIRRLIKKRFIDSYKFLYHKIYTSRSYITGRIDNFVELFLLEKKNK